MTARRRASATLPCLALLGLATACRPPSGVLVRRSAVHMGTEVAITVVAAGEAAGNRAIDRALAEVARLDRLLSHYKPDSDLSRLNAQAGAGPVAVPPELIEVSLAALQIAARSAGAFNPLLGPVIRLWGIPENPHLPSAEEIEKLRPLTDLSGISIQAERGTISLAHPGMALSLGGIAKGYTADRVAEILTQQAMRGAMVAIGGDIRVFGRRPDGHPWRVAIRNPWGEADPLAVIELDRGAVSTSGDYERFFEVDGIRFSHILDPRTLRPARAFTSVTILAPTAVEADGLATAVLVMGPEDGMALVGRTKGVEALAVTGERKLLASDGWPQSAAIAPR